MATRTRSEHPPVRRGDRIFSATALGAGILILLILAGVAIFLLVQGVPGITAGRGSLSGRDSFWAYVGPFAFGTVYASIIALVVAVPIAVGIALFISHYAPRRVASALGYIVDLLAAVPSVVFGVWGITVLSPALVPIMQWLEDNAGFLPFFEGPTLTSGRNMFTAGLVLAVMILPIITAICREVFLQTPRLHEEAALALGATRWEMIRMTVFPYGRSGIVSASMLGLGRALGETLAVALVLSGSAIYTFNTLAAENSGTIAANIALQFPEASGTAVNVLIATGLILFVITFAVNYTARKIVDRRSEFSGAN